MRMLAPMALLIAGGGVLNAQTPVRPDRFGADSAAGTSTQGIAFVVSAILPGAGQYYLKSDRWVPFVAVEAWAWVKHVEHHRRGRRLEREYRDLAWNVARRFSTSSRKDSVFTYYEAMGHFRDSGLFDADPGTPGIQPELDPTTFNGDQWKRARALFLRGGEASEPGSSDYEKALAYYRANAIPDGYIWSWGNSRLEQEEFQRIIARSDAAFRAATRMMGVILANHIVSAVDALVLARVKILNEQGVRIGSNLEALGSTSIWTTTVRIPLPGARRVGDPGTDH